MLYIVIDANVWVSAFAFESDTPNQVLDLVRTREVRSITSESLVSQVTRALDRLKVAPGLPKTAEVQMRRISQLIVPTLTIDEISGKDSDNRVLECAVEGKADYIVTGE